MGHLLIPEVKVSGHLQREHKIAPKRRVCKVRETGGSDNSGLV